MWFLAYNIGLLLALPVMVVMLLAKKRCRRGMLQRLGLALPALPIDDRPTLWLHAVSLGEVVAAVPLVQGLKARHPRYRIVVSTVTETGREAVEHRLAGLAEHCYAPLDVPWAVARLVARLRPALFVFMETELWPNQLRHLARRGVATVLVNGRLSTRSYEGYRLVRGFFTRVLDSVTLCLMQSDRDVDRIVGLGAKPDRVRRIGNVKFDQPLPDLATDRGPTREDLGLLDGEEVFVAGSTHPGEEEALVAAFKSLLPRFPTLVLLLAPRHIERAEEVKAMVRAEGLPVVCRTEPREDGGPGALKKKGGRVIILDTRGELASVYRLAVVTYLGGTLVPVGGHNPLEPASWGKPVLFGPYTDHCAELADWLLQAGGAMRIHNTDELTSALARCLGRRSDLERMGQAARRLVESNRGTVERCLKALDPLLAHRGGTVTGTSSTVTPVGSAECGALKGGG